MSLKYSFNAKAYYLTTGSRATWGTLAAGIVSGAAPASIAVISAVKDIEVNMDDSEIDVSTRAGAGVKMTANGLTNATVEIPMIYDATDAAIIALMKAKLTRATIAVAFLDDLATVVGAEGLWADWCVTKMKKGETLDGVQMITFSLTYGYTAVPPEWVKVAAP